MNRIYRHRTGQEIQAEGSRCAKAKECGCALNLDVPLKEVTLDYAGKKVQQATEGGGLWGRGGHGGDSGPPLPSPVLEITQNVVDDVVLGFLI
jgi:hypothetical protein